MRAVQTRPPDTSPAELRLAAVSLERRLSVQVRTYVERYELGPADLEQALRSGEIRETAEIADWVIVHRTLIGLADELQARPAASSSGRG